MENLSQPRVTNLSIQEKHSRTSAIAATTCNRSSKFNRLKQDRSVPRRNIAERPWVSLCSEETVEWKAQQRTKMFSYSKVQKKLKAEKWSHFIFSQVIELAKQSIRGMTLLLEKMQLTTTAFKQTHDFYNKHDHQNASGSRRIFANHPDHMIKLNRRIEMPEAVIIAPIKLSNITLGTVRTVRRSTWGQVRFSTSARKQWTLSINLRTGNSSRDWTSSPDEPAVFVALYLRLLVQLVLKRFRNITDHYPPNNPISIHFVRRTHLIILFKSSVYADKTLPISDFQEELLDCTALDVSCWCKLSKNKQ